MTKRPLVTFRESLLVLFVVLLPFQDTGLQRTALRYFGTSFAVIPLLGLIAIDVARWLSSTGRRVYIPGVLAAMWCILLTLAYMVVFGQEWAGIDLRVKALKNMSLTVLALWTIARPGWNEFRYLRISVQISFWIAVCGVLFCDLNVLGLGKFFGGVIFHGGDAYDARWHGFSPETSMLSLVLGNLGLLSSALSRSNVAAALYLVLTVAALALSGSKGGLICVTVAAVTACVGIRQKRLVAVTCIAAMVPLIAIGFDRHRQLFSPTSISETTTFASRTTLVFWALRVASDNPLGVGFGGFYPAFTKYLPAAMETTARVSPIPLNLEEVRAYISSDLNASTKVGFMDFLALFGIPFVLVFVGWNWRTVRLCARNGNLLLLIAVVFDLIAFCTYNNSLLHYNMFIVVGIARATQGVAKNSSSRG